MQNVEIRKKIAVRTKAQRETIDGDGLREFWLDAIKFDPLDLFEFGEEGRMYLRDLDTLPLGVRRMIAKIDFGNRGVTVKFVDRLQMSSKLGRALGDISEEVEQVTGLFPLLLDLVRSSGPDELDRFVDGLSQELRAMVPDEYWEERKRPLDCEDDGPEEAIWLLATEDMTKVQQSQVLCSFLSRAIRFDPLDIFESDEGGMMIVKDLRIIRPDVRRLITEMGTDRHGRTVLKIIDKDGASSLLDRVLRIFDPTGEEDKADGTTGIVARLLKEIRFASIASMEELVCLQELLRQIKHTHSK
jgi:hypothetical protein